MVGGLNKTVKEWYEEQILDILSKYKRVDTRTIAYLVRKRSRKYPADVGRITALLQYLRGKGKVRYIPKQSRRVPAYWELIRR